ncbi:MAG: hypothetical protein J5582_03315 [Ruminococcus sp.]|uniref:hypothetical protein n=1 Tax=Ruminococcus sp. TaxID=41978 RepID=UPI0025F35BE0|nr:hypothetical protein [Ruminococcus sp.]MBO4865588.1 hypothetical protein [Ruminococcus sp.]
MINEEHLAKLSAPIKRIVDEELAAGNVVKETYIGKADGRIFVFLKYRFTAKHDCDAEYLVIDDRHYWYAEYSDSKCTVACGFDELKAGS